MSRSKKASKQRVPIPCIMSGCTVTCLRGGDIRRHLGEVHGHKVYCPMPGCNFRGAKRRQRFKDHLLKHHRDHRLVNLNIPMDDHKWYAHPPPSGCQMLFNHQAFGGNNSTSLDFLLSTSVVGASTQQHVQPYGQQSSFSIPDYPFSREIVSMNSFDLSHDMHNMQINDPQHWDLDAATDVVIMMSDSSRVSRSPSEYSLSPL